MIKKRPLISSIFLFYFASLIKCKKSTISTKFKFKEQTSTHRNRRTLIFLTITSTTRLKSRITLRLSIAFNTEATFLEPLKTEDSDENLHLIVLLDQNVHTVAFLMKFLKQFLQNSSNMCKF